MKIIIGNENDEKQSENSGNEEVKRLMDATLLTSQIGYVMPKEDFAHVLAENLTPNTSAAAKKTCWKACGYSQVQQGTKSGVPKIKKGPY